MNRLDHLEPLKFVFDEEIITAKVDRDNFGFFDDPNKPLVIDRHDMPTLTIEEAKSFKHICRVINEHHHEINTIYEMKIKKLIMEKPINTQHTAQKLLKYRKDKYAGQLELLENHPIAKFLKYKHILYQYIEEWTPCFDYYVFSLSNINWLQFKDNLCGFILRDAERQNETDLVNFITKNKTVTVNGHDCLISVDLIRVNKNAYKIGGYYAYKELDSDYTDKNTVNFLYPSYHAIKPKMRELNNHYDRVHTEHKGDQYMAECVALVDSPRLVHEILKKSLFANYFYMDYENKINNGYPAYFINYLGYTVENGNIQFNFSKRKEKRWREWEEETKRFSVEKPIFMKEIKKEGEFLNIKFETSPDFREYYKVTDANINASHIHEGTIKINVQEIKNILSLV